jgi:hypothetical protein
VSLFVFFYNEGKKTEGVIHMKKQFIGGLSVTGLGILMLAANFGMISGLWVLWSLAVGFLGAYLLFEPHLGFLIPGVMLGGLAAFASLGSVIQDISGAYLFFFFSAAFYLVFALHTRKIQSVDQGEKIWPFFPGTALLIVGALVLGIEGNTLSDTFLRSLNMVFPAALILIGIVLFVRNLRIGSSR